MINWIIQNNLIKEDLTKGLTESALKYGHNAIGLKIIPFSEGTEWSADIGFTPPEGKIIPYGSTAMIKMVDRSKWNKDGFFFNQKNLKTSTWVKELGNRMLNHDAQFMTLEEATKIGSGEYFMKPDDDLKDFTGCHVDLAEIQRFYDNVSAGGFLFGTNLPVVLTSLKNTGWEYRCFMIGDRVIASSSYKLKSMFIQDRKVPQEIIDYAQETAGIWHPDQVYVMDISETDNGLKVVEFNCFNASGMYACSYDTVVREVSEFVSKK